MRKTIFKTLIFKPNLKTASVLGKDECMIKSSLCEEERLTDRCLSATYKHPWKCLKRVHFDIQLKMHF